MAWQIPIAGQWPAAMGMPQEMGTYTPEQWTALQQNWQQWNQWQQQYTQWQQQYGEKYAQHLQTAQAIGGLLPMPGHTAPPAPPPPEQPPPPPHENNQPLFKSNNTLPSSAPGQKNLSNYSNAIPTTGNQWSYGTDSTTQVQSAVNTEALNKLAEEEKLFDIQFKKWEEEIDKWRKENKNHPDKQAYKEYEQKFEACRAQLLERRRQMNLKRARLLNNTPQTANTSSGNTPTPAHTTTQNNIQSTYNQDPQTQNYKNNVYPPDYNSKPYSNINKSNIKNIDPQDRYESYQNIDGSGEASLNTYPSAKSDPSAFLPTTSSGKTIPGLDLVPDTAHGSKSQDVIDITEDRSDRHNAPDYSKISKGINNILGDEKIMNILSLVQGQNISEINALNAYIKIATNQNCSLNQGNRNPPNFMQGNGNNQNMSINRQGPNFPILHNLGMISQYPSQGMYNDGQNLHNNMQADMRQSGHGMRQGGFDEGQGGNNMGPSGPPIRHGGLNMQQAGPDMRQSGPNMRQGGPDMRQGVPDMRHGGPDKRHGGSDMRHGGANITQGIPDQGGSNLPDIRHPSNQGMQPSYDNRSIPPLMSLNSRPPLLDMSAQQNINDYYGSEHSMCDNNPVVQQLPRLKWVEEPLFTPSIVVEYDHKPLRLKARDFIEPVHTFDYNHRSKDEDLNKKKDFEKEVEQLFTRKPKRDDNNDRYVRDTYHKDYERRMPREEINRNSRDTREDYRDARDDFRERPRDRIREDFERRRGDDRFEDRRRDENRDFRRDERRDERREDRRDDKRDDRDRYYRRDDFRDRERDIYGDRNRDDRFKDMSRDDFSARSISRELDTRKRGLSSEEEIVSKKSKDSTNLSQKKHIVMIDDLLEPPGRDMRPEKIVIILRGIPGSGKSYLAKLIRDREAELGGAARIMSIDDYFMQEGETDEKDPQTGKIVKKPFMKYEYDESLEETYLNSLKRAFKRSLTDGYFSFLIYDAINDQLKHYADIWNYARQNGFQVYICTMEQDLHTCFKRNIHNRSLEDLQVLRARFFPTPAHHIQLDATTLLQNAAIPDVTMEDASSPSPAIAPEVESVFTSKWEKMDDAAQLARLDGTSKPLRPSQLSMEDYLQLDEWRPNIAKPGKKTVRWADIEERREQEKMRAIGFVVGQTDWNRMTDPTMGSSALTQTKYIERVRR